MKKRYLLVRVSCAFLSACGGPPADVAGNYEGSSQISVSQGETGGGAEFVQVNQNGGELSFLVGGCSVKAHSNSSTTFAVDDFKCTRMLTTSSWELNVNEGTVTANANNLIMAMKGTATSGARTEQLTFNFNGSKR